MQYSLKKRCHFKKLCFDELFSSPSEIKNYFHEIWYNIIEKSGINISENVAKSEIKNLVLYEALDGSRSTPISKKHIEPETEGVLYAINFINVLRSLGVKTCVIMIHSSYNRRRGENEFRAVLHHVEAGASLIKRYAIENSICCKCLCINENYELMDLLNDVTESTRNGEFCTYFLFDYNEEWAMTKMGQRIIKNLPDIDAHIRHTKFQFSGGWIPGKMSRSVFLYSQNGSTYSNWDTYDIVTLVSLSLLAKLIHKGEILNKTYKNEEEIIQRYRTRELELFNKIIYLKEKPTKLCTLGSPIGLYTFYY